MSLGGLTTALALANVGVSSTVLERTSARTQRGVAILVAMSGLSRAVGSRAHAIIAKTPGSRALRQGTSPHARWASTRDRLLRARDRPDADYAGHVVWLGQSELSERDRRRDGQRGSIRSTIGDSARPRSSTIRSVRARSSRAPITVPKRSRSEQTALSVTRCVPVSHV